MGHAHVLEKGHSTKISVSKNAQSTIMSFGFLNFNLKNYIHLSYLELEKITRVNTKIRKHVSRSRAHIIHTFSMVQNYEGWSLLLWFLRNQNCMGREQKEITSEENNKSTSKLTPQI